MSQKIPLPSLSWEDFMAEELAYGVVDNASYVGVVTSMGPKVQHYSVKSYTKERALDLIIQNLESPSFAGAEEASELARALNRQMMSTYQKDHLISRLFHHPEYRMSAWISLVSKSRQELWVLGRGQFEIEGDRYYSKRSMDQMMTMIFQEQERLSIGSGRLDQNQLRSDLEPFQTAASQFQNNLSSDSPLSYGCLDGFLLPEDFIYVLPLEDVGEITLFSTASFLEDNLDRMENVKQLNASYRRQRGQEAGPYIYRQAISQQGYAVQIRTK